MLQCTVQEGIEVTTGEEFQYFTLGLPQNEALGFHRASGILSLLADIGYKPRLLAQQQFCGRECDLLLALVSSYPQMVPYEALSLSFCEGFDCLSQRSLLQAKQRLDALGGRKNEIKQIQKVMASVRLKLRECGLEVRCLSEVGYVLVMHQQEGGSNGRSRAN